MKSNDASDELHLRSCPNPLEIEVFHLILAGSLVEDSSIKRNYQTVICYSVIYLYVCVTKALIRLSIPPLIFSFFPLLRNWLPSVYCQDPSRPWLSYIGKNCFQGDTAHPSFTSFVKSDDVWQTGPGPGQHPIRPQPDTKAPPQPLDDKDTNKTLTAGLCYFANPGRWPCFCLPLFLTSLLICHLW